MGEPEKGHASTPEPPENSTENPEDAPGVGWWDEPAQEQAEIVAIGRVHADRGELAATMVSSMTPASRSRRAEGAVGSYLSWAVCAERQRGRWLREGPGSHLIEANRHCLAQVHRRLARIGRNLHQQMALGKIFARETMLLRPKDSATRPPCFSSRSTNGASAGSGITFCSGLR